MSAGGRAYAPAAEVQVWAVALDRDLGVEAARHLLSPAERDHAARLRSSVDARRYQVGRAALRLLLGGRLGCEATAVPLATGEHGKPCLDPARGCRLRFNLSHSGALALVVIARDREVGVDIERIEPGLAVDGLAGRVLSPGDRAALADLDPTARTTAFFDLWVRKEAYLKGIGLGLRADPERIDVRGIGIGQVRCDGAPSDWWLHPVDAGAGHAAAVAVHGRGARVPVLPAAFRSL